MLWKGVSVSLVLSCISRLLLLTYPRKSGWSGSSSTRRSGSYKLDSALLTRRGGVWRGQKVHRGLGPSERGPPQGWGASCEELLAAFWTSRGRSCKCGQLAVGGRDTPEGGSMAYGNEGLSGWLTILGTWSGMEQEGQGFTFVPL